MLLQLDLSGQSSLKLNINAAKSELKLQISTNIQECNPGCNKLYYIWIKYQFITYKMSLFDLQLAGAANSDWYAQLQIYNLWGLAWKNERTSTTCCIEETLLGKFDGWIWL